MAKLSARFPIDLSKFTVVFALDRKGDRGWAEGKRNQDSPHTA